MANEEQLVRLREGPVVWNLWRAENPVAIDLSDADLRGVDLERANLADANLVEARLSGARGSWGKFEGANLIAADLTGAMLIYADFGGAHLMVAHLSGAKLSGADFQGADLAGADLSGADLSVADLRRARLGSRDEMGVQVGAAELTKARLRGADLTGADLKDADLSGCDLTDVRGLELDACGIRGARFSPYTQDLWSTLRRNYTGAKFFFHLLLLVAFVTPYVARVLFWGGVNAGQTAISTALSYGIERLDTRGTVDRPDAAARRRILLEASRVKPCGAEKCEEVPIWKVLVGADEGWRVWLLAGVLIVYNILRAGLTYLVGPLRDEEERSGYSPRKADYAWMKWPHLAMTFLIFAAVTTLLVHAADWLTRPVWLPVR